MATVVLVAGCGQLSWAQSDDVPDVGDTVSLTLLGYNYTDHTISSYSVNGAWGAGIAVSDSGSGGGKFTCCVRWVVGQQLPVTVHVRWESHMCTYKEKVQGQVFTSHKLFYSEKDVQLTQATTNDPHYFETHFYPDGHIEVVVTHELNGPRLKLPVTYENGRRERPGAAPIPECTPEQLQGKAG